MKPYKRARGLSSGIVYLNVHNPLRQNFAESTLEDEQRRARKASQRMDWQMPATTILGIGNLRL